MTDERHLAELMAEMKRVGVDPDGFPAGVTVSRQDALRALATLADGAGPAAFLSALRGTRAANSGETPAG